VGRVRAKGSGEDERDQIGQIYFVFLYENRTMKLVEIVLRGKRNEREQWRW
jgi:hypothetical protein